jgi:hypothetical protein
MNRGRNGVGEVEAKNGFESISEKKEIHFITD